MEPTNKQRAQLEGLASGRLALVQFLVIENHDAFHPYLTKSEDAVKESGGERSHRVYIDQYRAGGEMPYQAHHPKPVIPANLKTHDLRQSAPSARTTVPRSSVLFFF